MRVFLETKIRVLLGFKHIRNVMNEENDVLGHVKSFADILKMFQFIDKHRSLRAVTLRHYS